MGFTMSLIAPLRALRQRLHDDHLQQRNAAFWTTLWAGASFELRTAVAHQVSLTSASRGRASNVVIDDAVLISEIVAMDCGAVDADALPITYSSVQRTVAFRLLPEARAALAQEEQVREAIAAEATLRAEAAAAVLEDLLRARWPHHIKVRTRTRFLIEGIETTPTGGEAFRVLVLESSGHTSRQILPADAEALAAVHGIADLFEDFPTIVLALGAKVGREIWAVPPHPQLLAALPQAG